MSSIVSILSLVASVLFAALAGGMLALPGWLPGAHVWRAVVFVAAARAAPPPGDFTLVGIICGKTKTPQRFLVPVLAVDVVAVALVIAFLDLPGAAFDTAGRVVFSAVLAGIIPGWPAAGREGMRLLRRVSDRASRGTTS